MIEKIKNAAVFLLILTALCQAANLWTDASADYNPFYLARSLFFEREEYLGEKAALAVPSRIISKNSGGVYRVKYNNLGANVGKYNCDAVLDEFFLSGKFEGIKEIDPDDAPSCVIYDYSVKIPSEAFAECFLQNASSFKAKANKLASRSEGFRRVVFIPCPEGDPSNIATVCFDDGSSAAVFTVKIKPSVNSSLWLYIKDGSVSDLTYFRQGGLFIPIFLRDGFVYHPLYGSNPYISPDGVLTLKSAQRTLSPLFGNASITQAEPDDAGYRYSSDANSVVKYNAAANVVEYSDYSAAAKNAANTLPLNYAAAAAFLNADPALKTDRYLAGYDFDGSRYSFYFNYAVNDLPVFIPDSMKQDLGMSYMLEITVTRQKVVKYKKIALNFFSDESSFDAATLSYRDFSEPLSEGGGQPSDVKLAYKYDKFRQLTLSWFLSLNGRSYAHPARG
ncbi:MAG: hypothetical protein LBU36_01240 [Clostridiales bacterium]|jgi:hypothetical protein|nr:hypothetical protein [Clostridiales bacterium]